NRSRMHAPPQWVGLNIHRFDSANIRWRWWWEFDEGSLPHDWSVLVPIWMLALPSLLTSATAWRLDTLARRRARVGLCPKCGYNLAGLPPTSPCPECGQASR